MGYSIKIYHNTLFSGLGGYSDSTLAKFENGAWSLVKGSPGGGIYALSVYKGELYCGGSYIDSLGYGNIARYYEPPLAINTLANSRDETLSDCYPNPVNNSSTISYHFKNTTTNAFIKIYNIKGVLIKEFKLDSKAGAITFESNNLAEGIYIYELEADGHSIAQKKLVIVK